LGSVAFVFHEAHFAPTTDPFPVGFEIISPYYPCKIYE
jgi:hypothetical protein